MALVTFLANIVLLLFFSGKSSVCLAKVHGSLELFVTGLRE